MAPISIKEPKKLTKTKARVVDSLSVSNIIDTYESPNPASQISEERSHTNFDVVKMHQFLEGSVEKSNLILSLYKSIERDPILQTNFEHYDLGYKDERALVASRIDRMARYLEIEDSKKFLRRLNLMTVIDPSMGIRIAVNLGLFLHCIKGNGTDDQFNYWAHHEEAASIKKLYGCFGMTELGHGSNVAGCETTATFDIERDEFVIDTPNISATKWWIGGAAHSATHTVCYARLIVKGKDYGVKTFIVPLRDSQHNLLPGVAIGDIGAKMGRQGVDNGWIQFSDVRIPRYYMLQRWCKVDKFGNVSLPPLEQLSYISLLQGRVGMSTDSYRIGARFITIALRYAVGRRQFKKDPSDKLESKLLDYTLHQRRLIPYLALTYAMAVGTDRLEKQHDIVLEELEQALKANSQTLINKSLIDTKALFIDSASVKSTLTWLAADLINEARQACGGHGYSSYNGFGKTYSDWVVQCTWEGDNNVLGIAAGKTIIKNVEQITEKKRPIKTPTLLFLNDANQWLNSDNVIIATNKDAEDYNKIKSATKGVIVKFANLLLQELKRFNGDWDLISHDRVRLSKLRAHYYLLETFIDRYESNKEEKLAPHLLNLLKLYYVSQILIPFAAEFIRFKLLSSDVSSWLTLEYTTQLDLALRPYVIGLTDSFQQPDNFINSLIGKYDGNIYENYLNTIKQIHPPRHYKAPYSGALEAMLNRPSLEERDRFEKSEEAEKKLTSAPLDFGDDE